MEINEPSNSSWFLVYNVIGKPAAITQDDNSEDQIIRDGRLTSLTVITYYILFYVYMCLACMSVCPHTHAWCLSSSKEGVRLPGSGVTEGWEFPRECWEENQVLRKKRQGFNFSAISQSHSPFFLVFHLFT